MEHCRNSRVADFVNSISRTRTIFSWLGWQTTRRFVDSKNPGAQRDSEARTLGEAILFCSEREGSNDTRQRAEERALEEATLLGKQKKDLNSARGKAEDEALEEAISVRK